MSFLTFKSKKTQKSDFLPPYGADFLEPRSILRKTTKKSTAWTLKSHCARFQTTAAKAKVEQDLARPHYYYPDLFGRKNCVRDGDYEDWMQGAVSFLSIRFVIDSVITQWRPRGCTFSLHCMSRPSFSHLAFYRHPPRCHYCHQFVIQNSFLKNGFTV